MIGGEKGKNEMQSDREKSDIVSGSSELAFRDLNYRVKAPNNEELHILRHVSGSVKAGRLTAIIGASGSGKSTMLDVLAQRKTRGRVNGFVELDGVRIPKPACWKRITGYVMQQDQLLGTATVYETLLFSLQLRTPMGLHTRQEQDEKIDQLLKQIGMMERKHARIGTEESRSLSGGEQRRVSIAVELVADLNILFLDEPTSGLDSTTARHLCELMRDICREGKIVVASVHQPSSQIASLFDDVLVLGKGEILFRGAMDSLVPELSGLGFKCPQFMNPTDFAMDLASMDDSRIALARSASESYDRPRRTPSELRALENLAASTPDGPLAPFSYQLLLLWRRSLKNWLRNPLIFISELIQYLVTGIFIGLMYLNVSDDAVAGSFDRFSAIFFILTSLAFVPSFTVITQEREARPLEQKEIGAGMYSIAANFLAKTLTLLPFEIFLALIFSICSYFLVGFQLEASRFFIFFLIVVLFLLISETIGYICAITTPNATVGVLVLSIVLLVALALGGFLVSKPRSFYEWTEKINFFVYGLTAMTRNEFEGLTLYFEGQPVDALTLQRLPNNLSKGANIAVLAAMLVLFRLTTLMLLIRKNSKRGRQASFTEKEEP